jgi:hypothetical protein
MASKSWKSYLPSIQILHIPSQKHTPLLPLKCTAYIGQSAVMINLNQVFEASVTISQQTHSISEIKETNPLSRSSAFPPGTA